MLESENLMFKCPVSVLRSHSAGKKFAPVAVANGFHLVNSDGDILVGYRGKVFEFTTHKNALDWLKTNLSRYKNKTQETGVDFLLQIGNIYLETGLEATNQEAKDIFDYEHGLWEIVEFDEVIQIVEIEAVVDYDGGNADGLVI